MKIMLVGEDFLNVNSLKSDLLKLGHEVWAIVQGAEAAPCSTAELFPDLIIEIYQ